MSRPHTPRLAAVATLVAVVLLLACGGTTSLVATYSPRWACPSPTPQPYGEAGPVKGYEPCNCRPDPVTEQPSCDECPVFYAEWEQEYPEASGPPFPSPTPFGIVGTNFVFGQRVEIGPLHALMSAVSGARLAETGGTPRQLMHVQITWSNPTGTSIPFAYATQVVLRAVEGAGGVVQTAAWGTSAEALTFAGVALPDAIPPGTSQVHVPILAPPGEPHIVEIRLWADATRFPPLPTETPLPDAPTPTTAPTATLVGTPTPNDQLAVGQGEWLVVQWSNTRMAPQLPTCGDPGALTDWSYDDPGAVHGRAVAGAVAAPPGADRLVQIALNQVGKPYVFGAKGPEQFDCSGLATWSYAQIGIAIPQGTSGQWPGMRPVTADRLQPGDLVFFALGRLGERVDHVGVLVGDLNGNGQWDMVHAANPTLGVRIDYDIFSSAYYGPRIVGFRTAR